jgi:hypothetical protein
LDFLNKNDIMKQKQKPTWTILALGLAASAHLAQAAAPSSPQGYITGKAFLNINGTAVGALTSSPKFPDHPDDIFFYPYFEWAATDDISTPPGNWGDNYGGQIVGYFYPPSSGEYTFWISADDGAALYLSIDSDPANKKLIAQETGWSNAREYDMTSGSSDVPSKDSSQFPGTEWETTDSNLGGAIIELTKGQSYYIEALFKEGGGGDNLSVAVMDPGGVIDPFLPIPGEYLSSDRNEGPVTIVTQPQDQTVDERGTAVFNVHVDGTPPYSYQWFKNGEAIADATGLSVTVSNVSAADAGSTFSVEVTGDNGTVTSDVVTLNFVPDTVAPVLLGAKGLPNLTEIILSFSEALTAASAEDVANYSVSSSSGALNITDVTLSPTGTAVTLKTAQQTLGKKYTILVNNVQDIAAEPNAIAADSKAVIVPVGKLTEMDGFIVFEMENYDRNLDGLWTPDSDRGNPSGGVSMVVPNGAGGNEANTRLEYDITFPESNIYYVWYRASGADGTDDSAWLYIDDERPFGREDGNSASMTGFSGAADFVWRSDAQDGPDPFTIDVLAGDSVVAIARREDGSFFDKMIFTLDPDFVPTGTGPAETREGVPGRPTVQLTGAADGTTIDAGGSLALSATGSADGELLIERIEFSANGEVIAVATSSPFEFTWNNVPAGIYGVSATAYDEIGQSVTSDSVTVVSSAGSDSQAANIAWVSFHAADDEPAGAAATAGFTQAPDVAYTDLLTSAGHRVTRVVTGPNPDVGVLNAYDMVIISRSVSSGDYQDPPETLAWNSVEAPTLILGGYILRTSRLGLTDGTAMVDTTGPIKLQVEDPGHPIFKDVELDGSGLMVNDYAGIVEFDGTVQRGVSINNNEIAGNGVLLATVGTDEDPTWGGPVIAEWQAGDTTANGRDDVLGGQRVIVLTGSREHDGLTAQGAGIYDLTENGAKILLNTVTYMTGKEGGDPVQEPVEASISMARDDSGITITFTGTLQSADSVNGPWAQEGGANSPMTVDATGGMKFYRAVP